MYNREGPKEKKRDTGKGAREQIKIQFLWLWCVWGDVEWVTLRPHCLLERTGERRPWVLDRLWVCRGWLVDKFYLKVFFGTPCMCPGVIINVESFQWEEKYLLMRDICRYWYCKYSYCVIFAHWNCNSAKLLELPNTRNTLIYVASPKLYMGNKDVNGLISLKTTVRRRKFLFLSVVTLVLYW